MELIEIAQLVTGVATLIVASVLIWQMIIQKKTLDIAHNDADSNMSLQAMESRSEQNRWFSENTSKEMLEKMKKGYDFLDEFEKKILSSHYWNNAQVLSTEYRLGRLNRNREYYKFTFQIPMMMEEYKACRDLFESHYIRAKSFSRVTSNEWFEIGKEVYEESSGEKLGDSNE
tara:strand:+ start:191 stop:709 length:519 start_codon:yes stop_codon:yes gene_type:complete